MSLRSHQKDRREVNPALGLRKLKLGTFQTNLDFGLRDVGSRRPARTDLAEYRDAGAARRRDGVRGAGAGGALARLWRRDRSARPGLRDLHLGRRHCRRDKTFRRDLDLACRAQSSDRRRQAIDRHRSYFRWPLHAQHRQRLEFSGNGNVRRLAPRTRRPLRLRRGMADNRQAAVERGRQVRLRRQVLPHQGRLLAAEADPDGLIRSS